MELGGWGRLRGIEAVPVTQLESEGEDGVVDRVEAHRGAFGRDDDRRRWSGLGTKR